MIDLHSHILRGVDDGARTLEDSVEIARAAVADGIGTLAATPHVRDDWPTDAGVMEYRVHELNVALREAGVPLDVRPGGEIALDWLEKLPGAELRRFGLGGNPHYLLVETPYYGWPLGLADQLFALRADGITPVLAHPERNAEVQAHPGRIAQLVESGVLVQVTAASIDGRIGQRTQECAVRLVREGFAHVIASDAHHASVRAIGMSAAVEAVGDALGQWLTRDVPAAILGDTAIPPRPDGEKRGSLIGRLFGA